MGKLKIFPHEQQAFDLAKKEITLHFVGVLSAILLGSFSGFAGLLTAAIWNYQLRITNKESIENKNY